jgi:hypothetical protein
MLLTRRKCTIAWARSDSSQSEGHHIDFYTQRRQTKAGVPQSWNRNFSPTPLLRSICFGIPLTPQAALLRRKTPQHKHVPARRWDDPTCWGGRGSHWHAQTILCLFLPSLFQSQASWNIPYSPFIIVWAREACPSALCIVKSDTCNTEKHKLNTVRFETPWLVG